MRLDFNSANGKFLLYVKRGEADPRQIMLEHGLNWYQGYKTTPGEALLFTDEPYAAVTFWQYATEAAQEQLLSLQCEIEKSWALDAKRIYDTRRDLWPFQKASLAYALERKHSLIADQPGLGKTDTAIAFANEIRAKRVLVVCPAAIRIQWISKIKALSTMGMSYDAPNTLVYSITSSSGGVHDEAAWTVISWDLVRSPGIGRALAKGKYDLLILDEAHYAKHGERGRTRAIFGGGRDPAFEPLAGRCERIVALTGTPLPNRPREAYVLARNLCWDCIDFASEDAFNERFNPVNFQRTKKGKIWADERVGRQHELQNRLRAHMMVRHLKREVMPQLQYPAYDLVYIEETQAIRAALAKERLLDIDPEDLSGADVETLGHIAQVRKEMGVAIAPGVANYIIELLEAGEDKVTAFAWHKDVVAILAERLYKYGAVTVTGDDDARTKGRKVQTFIKDADCRVIIGNVLSLGTGTDGLQYVCTHAVLAEPDWANGNNEQAIDRLHRGGQTGKVLADFCVVQGSFSERVLASSLRKAQVVHKSLDARVL